MMIRKKLDKIVVVDVEATCWQGQPPQGEENQIIEVGVCLLDVTSGERTERNSILVRSERSKVSAFCTQLTTLTQEQVDGGVCFAEGCERLKVQFKSNQRLWASYGDYDRQMFQTQCGQCDVPYPFGKGHINVKSLFAVAFGLRKEIGLTRALERLDLPLEGTLHRGDDDAWNIAAILWRLVHSARVGGLVSPQSR